ncbi:hypothetical protein B0H67DRAFT_215961 [Lasiosphaeris hirsuta]|uniref:Uncharacterized protein n=1 Tax=Lasiosphaeris hirsuta TaxID=260670 RepID=A0AA40DWR5_9PEZI|nr:hypothetical protein B0H67DRAFT_215961 [Lasiosphaeris hirsuta]
MDQPPAACSTLPPKAKHARQGDAMQHEHLFALAGMAFRFETQSKIFHCGGQHVVYDRHHHPEMHALKSGVDKNTLAAETEYDASLNKSRQNRAGWRHGCVTAARIDGLEVLHDPPKIDHHELLGPRSPVGFRFLVLVSPHPAPGWTLDAAARERRGSPDSHKWRRLTAPDSATGATGQGRTQGTGSDGTWLHLTPRMGGWDASRRLGSWEAAMDDASSCWGQEIGSFGSGRPSPR